MLSDVYAKRSRQNLEKRADTIHDGMIAAHPSKDAIKFVKDLRKAALSGLSDEERAARDGEQVEKLFMN